MVVQHNMNAINSYNKLNANVAGMKKSSEKLSSGYRINRAGDDAAGLAVSEKMRSQIKGLNQAIRNSQDGINMIQTFEGAAQETHSILQRMKELASQSANGTYDDPTDRAAIQLEFDQLNDELNQIADTDFNGTIVLNGGEMADGTKAVNGKFDYANTTRQAQQLGTIGGFVTDISKDAFSTTKTDVETVTFTAAIDADGKVTWTKPESADGNFTMNTDNGGFAYRGAAIHVDTTKVVAGDTITVEFKPTTAEQKHTGEVIGTNTDYGTTTKAEIDGTARLTVEANVVASEGLANAVNALGGLSAEVTTTAKSTAATIKINGQTVPTAANTWQKLADTEDGGTISIDNAGNINYAAKGVTAGDGTKIASIGGINNGVITLGAAATTTGTAKIDYNVSKSSYVAAKPAEITIIEPESKVSQADSFNNSKAIMSYAENITLQTGARTKDSVNFTFNYNQDGSADMGDLKANLNLSARADGLNTENLSLATAADANHAIDQIDKAINKTSMVRASFGSIQNRLEHKITNLTTTSENLTEAESSIRDTDMASEMMNYTKFNILQQAAQSMLAQANQQPQSILQLLG